MLFNRVLIHTILAYVKRTSWMLGHKEESVLGLHGTESRGRVPRHKGANGWQGGLWMISTA